MRARLEQRSGLILPGCQDPLSARLVEAAGFAGAYLSGLAVNAQMGLPDLGTMDLDGMAARAGAIAAAISIPLFVDADDGFGGPAQAADCARRLEAAGAVGINVDDTLLPRAEGTPKTLAPVALAQEKIAAARGASSPDRFLIIGRTDAISTHGPEEALRRAQALEEAGADAMMVPYLTDAQEVRRFARALKTPLIIAITETARESFAAQDLAGAGHAAAVYPVTTLLAGLGAQARALAHLARRGDTQALESEMMPISELRGLTRPRARGADAPPRGDSLT